MLALSALCANLALSILVQLRWAHGFQMLTMQSSSGYLQQSVSSSLLFAAIDDDECDQYNMNSYVNAPEAISRRRILLGSLIASSGILTSSSAAVAVPEQKFYSQNAKNMARLSSGDKSGGSLYDNNPSSQSSAKRRAMLGCKVTSSRNLAAKDSGIDKLSEKDCNLKVMEGDSEFMLKALRKLDCPTCPYGISGA